MAERSISVRVPGTSANLGAGFDTLGLACNIYNELDLTLTEEPGLSFLVEGEGAGRIPEDERNIVWRSIRLLLERAKRGQEFRGAKIHMKNKVPLSRGLGSSAAAIVAGLKAANVLIGNKYNRRELLQMATEIEGHPDNVAPAIFGGFTVSTTKGRHVESFSFVPKVHLRFVVAVPDFEEGARGAAGDCAARGCDLQHRQGLHARRLAYEGERALPQAVVRRRAASAVSRGTHPRYV